MPTKPRCVITAFDGFDWDMLVNMACFYRCCGFAVSVSSRLPAAAELLVLQRGSWPSDAIFEGRFQQCHIYDYVGLPYVWPRSSVITTVSEYPFFPVIPALWKGGGRPRSQRRRLIHFGHVKPGLGGDPWQSDLETLVAEGRCEAFGDGWPSGPVSLHRAIELHRQADAALSIQYPYQRGQKVSSRMWQGPLSGCEVFSEAAPDGVDLPGVRRVGSYREALGAQRTPGIAKEAEAFWHEATTRLADRLGLHYQPPSTLAANTTYLKSVYWGHARAAARRLRIPKRLETATR